MEKYIIGEFTLTKPQKPALLGDQRIQEFSRQYDHALRELREATKAYNSTMKQLNDKCKEDNKTSPRR